MQGISAAESEVIRAAEPFTVRRHIEVPKAFARVREPQARLRRPWRIAHLKVLELDAEDRRPADDRLFRLAGVVRSRPNPRQTGWMRSRARRRISSGRPRPAKPGAVRSRGFEPEPSEPLRSDYSRSPAAVDDARWPSRVCAAVRSTSFYESIPDH